MPAICRTVNDPNDPINRVVVDLARVLQQHGIDHAGALTALLSLYRHLLKPQTCCHAVAVEHLHALADELLGLRLLDEATGIATLQAPPKPTGHGMH